MWEGDGIVVTYSAKNLQRENYVQKKIVIYFGNCSPFPRLVPEEMVVLTSNKKVVSKTQTSKKIDMAKDGNHHEDTSAKQPSDVSKDIGTDIKKMDNDSGKDLETLDMEEPTDFQQNPQAKKPGPILDQQYYDDATARFVPPQGYKKVVHYKFGSGNGNNIKNLKDLSKGFVSYLGGLGNGGKFAGLTEHSRYEHVFEPDLHVFTPNSIRLYVRPGSQQAIDAQGNMTIPSSKYSKNQWMRGSAIRAKEKFHKNAIFVVRTKFPHLVEGVFPASWYVAAYTFWPPEVDIFESWTTGDRNHPETQTENGHNRGDKIVYDNNWVTYQTAHRKWRKNNKGQRGRVIGRVNNWGKWVNIDGYQDDGGWHNNAGAPAEIAIDHYTTNQVRVGGLDFTTTWVDHVSGVIDDPQSQDPSKGVATWWLGKRKTREQIYWWNDYNHDWRETDMLSVEASMTTKKGVGKPDTFPQWLEIQEIIVYEPNASAFQRNVTEPKKNQFAGVLGGKFAKSIILQDGIFYGTQTEELIQNFAQY